MQLDHMTNEERKIYDMVVRRFLSVLYPPFVYEQTAVEGTAGGYTFAARGKQVTDPGWKAVYENGFQEEEEDTETQDMKGPESPCFS